MTDSGIPPELAELWIELRPELLRQVAALGNAVAALDAGPLAPEQLEQARSDAHQLAGSLGSFGFDVAGQAARALERRLKAEPAPGADEAPALSALTAELSERLDAGPPTPPAAPREAATGAIAAREAPGAPGAPEAATPHPAPTEVDVAIVEDDELLAELARHALEGRGWSTRWIADGEEALRQLGGGTAAPLRARLVLLDWELPSRSGIEVLRALAAEGLTRRSPVVMVTGRDSDAAIDDARRLGAAEHVAKPYSVERLVATVRALLG